MPAPARSHRSEKVVCYIVHDDHLLVFTHLDYPIEQAGVQVPAGTLDAGEDPVAGALREATEESALSGLRVVALLGEDDYDIAPVRDEVMHRRFFMLGIDGEVDLTARWEHRDPDPTGGGEAPRWECFWMPLAWAHGLSGGQGRFVGLAADLIAGRGRSVGGDPPPNVPVEPRAGSVDTSLWPGLEDPGHSQRYVERFRAMSAHGQDIEGESRLVDALAPRRAHLLDAGCGPGRHGGHLARLGHRVVGVDLDPVLIAAAREDHPGATWVVGDLATLDLPGQGIPEPFDGALLAGNVMDFLTPQVRAEALRRIAAHVVPGGFVLIGCRVSRGFTPAELDAALPQAGLRLEQRFATWDLQPWDPRSEFTVSVLRTVR